VLAKISVTWVVPISGLEECLRLPRRGVAAARITDDAGDGVMGSTWTMCSQDWTIALTREVFPIPESPAISTFNLGIDFPASVNGRRLGILMLGMMSCGALPLSIMFDGVSLSVSPSVLTAWLPRSSDPESEFRLDETLLRAEAPADVPKNIGVIGCDWLDTPDDLYTGESGLDIGKSSLFKASTGPFELEGLPSLPSLSLGRDPPAAAAAEPGISCPLCFLISRGRWKAAEDCCRETSTVDSSPSA
jgi:hypothetical protein